MPGQHKSRSISVKGHYRTYYVTDGKGGYKQKRKYIKKHKRTIKHLKGITIPTSMKARLGSPRTMTKKVPDNLIEGIKTLCKDQDHEYSVDIDFERTLDTPEQMLVMKGGPHSTIKVGDFEMFGHTHPNMSYPHPSIADLHSMQLMHPEFIVAQKTGKTIILNIEDFDRWREWKAAHSYRENKHTRAGTVDSKYGRDAFFRRTGVRAYPMVKNLKIELRDDPHREKTFPRTKAYPPHVSRNVLWPEDKK